MGCSLAGGRTVVLPADGHEIHAQRHADDAIGRADVVIMRVNWPDP
jgi:hypothetical protein